MAESLEGFTRLRPVPNDTAGEVLMTVSFSGLDRPRQPPETAVHAVELGGVKMDLRLPVPRQPDLTLKLACKRTERKGSTLWELEPASQGDADAFKGMGGAEFGQVSVSVPKVRRDVGPTVQEAVMNHVFELMAGRRFKAVPRFWLKASE